MKSLANQKFWKVSVSLLINCILLAGAIFMVIPFAWMLSTSLKPLTEVFTYNIQWLPSNPTFDGYRQVWKQLPFARMYFNSAFVAATITAVQLATCTLAAYAFARLRFPGRDVLFLGYVATMMIPAQVTMIPSFLLIRKLGIMDSYFALILPFLAHPFGTFLLRQFMLTLPVSLEDAALLDGCTRFQILRKIVVPLSRPALSTMGLFTFLFSWNDFMWPLIVTNRQTMRTLQVGLALLRTEQGTQWPMLMAATVLAILPLLVGFLFAQKQFIEGITLTGIKG